MKKTAILLFVILIGIQGFSQKKNFTVSDAVMGQWRQFAPDKPDGITTYTGTDDFTYVENYSTIYRLSVSGKDKTILASLSEINEALGKVFLEKISYIPYWDYSWKSPDLLVFTINSNYIVYNIKEKVVEYAAKLPKDAENIMPHTETGYVAFTEKNNLFFMGNNYEIIQITNEENEGIVCGSDYVHRQEFGIDKGIFWSPKGNLLAFYRKDETMVSDYPLVNINTEIATLKNEKYPMIGQKSEEVTLGIYNVETKKTVYMEVTDFTKERYLTSITWDLSEKYIYIGVLNSEQNYLKLNKYDASTGKIVKTLFEEINEKYVEPEHPLYFVDSDEFLYYSEKDGYDHLYLYNTEGVQIKQVTKGKWVVKSIVGLDQNHKNVFITATKDSPLETNLYKVNIKKGTITRLTPEKGTHSITLNHNGTYFFDTYSNTETPSISGIYDASSKQIKEVMKSKNKLEGYAMGEMKIGTIKAADNKTDLYYRLILPTGFDKSKKYPVIVYVYGGPHAQMTTDSWLGGASLWQQYMAQQGYIMFTLDNRGSAFRGFEFESVIHRNCGQNEVADQMKGVEFLKSLSYVDADKIGVHGWSYGGFMTTSLMTMHPETFKVGVAGGPVIDWKYYEVMYGERYMDTPEENPEGFENASLLNKADKLKGRLLMIHGYIDPVVVPQNSLDFIKACIKADTDLDYFIYPNSEHNMSGTTRVHLKKKVSRYFDDYLK